jgi:uncharacterized membrane protein YhaH (DUF805 family)
MPMTQFLFSFSGRVNRVPYWLTSLALLFMAAIVLVLLLVLSTAAGVTESFAPPPLPALAAFIPLVWISLAVSAKRLHDRDKSAWWLLLFWLLPSVLERMADRTEGFGIVFTLASIALSIWAIVEMGFLRGTAGPNRYGPDPLAMQQPTQ